MKAVPLLILLALGGCSAMSGESEAPKPDPARFLPKEGGTAGTPDGPNAPPKTTP